MVTGGEKESGCARTSGSDAWKQYMRRVTWYVMLVHRNSVLYSHTAPSTIVRHCRCRKASSSTSSPALAFQCQLEGFDSVTIKLPNFNAMALLRHVAARAAARARPGRPESVDIKRFDFKKLTMRACRADHSRNNGVMSCLFGFFIIMFFLNE